MDKGKTSGIRTGDENIPELAKNMSAAYYWGAERTFRDKLPEKLYCRLYGRSKSHERQTFEMSEGMIIPFKRPLQMIWCADEPSERDLTRAERKLAAAIENLLKRYSSLSLAPAFLCVNNSFKPTPEAYSKVAHDMIETLIEGKKNSAKLRDYFYPNITPTSNYPPAPNLCAIGLGLLNASMCVDGAAPNKRRPDRMTRWPKSPEVMHPRKSRFTTTDALIGAATVAVVVNGCEGIPNPFTPEKPQNEVREVVPLGIAQQVIPDSLPAKTK